jgi:hypothetical protein
VIREKIIRSLSPASDAEALRVVRLLKYESGKKDFEYTLSITIDREE